MHFWINYQTIKIENRKTYKKTHHIMLYKIMYLLVLSYNYIYLIVKKNPALKYILNISFRKKFLIIAYGLN